MNEIPGFPGYYVNTLGDVFSDHIRRTSKRSSTLRNKLKPTPHKRGHLIVTLRNAEGNIRQRYVHALVMLTYVGEYPPNTEVRHLDGNPANNSVTNLCYGTRQENALDSIQHGTARACPGERHANAKLVNADIPYIRTCGLPTKTLSDTFGVSSRTIQLIRKKLAWKHIA